MEQSAKFGSQYNVRMYADYTDSDTRFLVRRLYLQRTRVRMYADYIYPTMTLILVTFWMMVDMGPGHKVFPLEIPNFVTTITRHNYQQKSRY